MIIIVLLIISFITIKSFTLASNIQLFQEEEIIHNAIEFIYLSNPGTSMVIYLKLNFPIICKNLGNYSIIEYSNLSKVIDPANIVIEQNSTKIVYSIKINSFTIPIGFVKISINKLMDNSIFLEVLK
ncbi:MAG: hypothetical protein QXW62_05570 [Candidatus Methanomethylicaceae archaeon]|nr:hypothetical protein [Candidatus Verstraetearchaeota archaeon]